MPIENSWGKSAVDATRKNALPPYLDTLIDYMESRIYTVTLATGTSKWIEEAGTNKYYQDVTLSNIHAADFFIAQADVNNIDEKISWGFIVRAQAYNGKIRFYALASRPTVTLTVYIAILGTNNL